MCWKNKVSFFDEEKKLILETFPSLKYRESEDIVYLSGKLQITNFSVFTIEIKFPNDYPLALPEIKETSKKIPALHDRHINNDNTCCIGMPAVMYQELGTEYTIIDYIEKFVIPFFVNQIHFEIYGEWSNGEYSHGIQGILEYYQEVFNTMGKKTILKFLKITTRATSKQYKSCPCGSGKIFKVCHYEQLLLVTQTVPLKQLKSDYAKLRR